jgi:hypothetical protein
MAIMRKWIITTPSHQSSTPWLQSLALVSAYGLADSGAQVLAGAAVGSHLSRWAQKWSRTHAPYCCCMCMMVVHRIAAAMPRLPCHWWQDAAAAGGVADVHAAERDGGGIGGNGIPAAGQLAAWRPAVLGADLRHHCVRVCQQRG